MQNLQGLRHSAYKALVVLPLHPKSRSSNSSSAVKLNGPETSLEESNNSD